jgi:hypothetical protein
MLPSRIDHIAVTAPTLEAGAAWVHQSLGITPETGGEHPAMGTHNLLLRLGDALYLEVIAPNPRAFKPNRPRWFGLDTLHPDSAPALSAWVARTPDIQKTASQCSESLGNIELMSRGALNWLITIPADGALPLGGIAPALIEWQTEVHPAETLQDFGLSLARIELFHPEPERISRLLQSIGLEGPFSVSVPSGKHTASLSAHINTLQGLRVI